MTDIGEMERFDRLMVERDATIAARLRDVRMWEVRYSIATRLVEQMRDDGYSEARVAHFVAKANMTGRELELARHNLNRAKVGLPPVLDVD